MKKKIWKRAAAGTMALAMAASLSACGGKEAGSTGGGSANVQGGAGEWCGGGDAGHGFAGGDAGGTRLRRDTYPTQTEQRSGELTANRH